LYTDFPDRFNKLEEVWVEFDGGSRQCFTLENSWPHKGRMVLKFAGIDAIGEAERLAGCWVEVPADRAVPLPEGTYFDHDLIGCSVQDTRGEKLGVVSGVLRIAGNSQLVLQGPEGECLIPLVQSICVRVSIKDKQIVVDPPEGLMDLGK
jgi:16S rRNA processing protein RimM